jgi:hypothetical protein
MIIEYNRHIIHFFNHTLPEEVKENIKDFIKADKKGEQGKTWRYSSRNFKKDLNNFLYKKIRESFNLNVYEK